MLTTKSIMLMLSGIWSLYILATLLLVSPLLFTQPKVETFPDMSQNYIKTVVEPREARLKAERERLAAIQPPAIKIAYTASPVVTGAVTGDVWYRLRLCESGNNYANKNNPTYRGAYQFSYQTWASVGGSGDPADAPPAEQDMRAKILLSRTGGIYSRSWPACSRKLGLP